MPSIWSWLRTIAPYSWGPNEGPTPRAFGGSGFLALDTRARLACVSNSVRSNPADSGGSGGRSALGRGFGAPAGPKVALSGRPRQQDAFVLVLAGSPQMESSHHQRHLTGSDYLGPAHHLHNARMGTTGDNASSRAFPLLPTMCSATLEAHGLLATQRSRRARRARRSRCTVSDCPTNPEHRKGLLHLCAPALGTGGTGLPRG
jgi:hypothetical protein